MQSWFLPQWLCNRSLYKSKVSKKASTKKEEKAAQDLNDVDVDIDEENVATKEQVPDVPEKKSKVSKKVSKH